MPIDERKEPSLILPPGFNEATLMACLEILGLESSTLSSALESSLQGQARLLYFLSVFEPLWLIAQNHLGLNDMDLDTLSKDAYDKGQRVISFPPLDISSEASITRFCNMAFELASNIKQLRAFLKSPFDPIQFNTLYDLVAPVSPISILELLNYALRDPDKAPLLNAILDKPISLKNSYSTARTPLIKAIEDFKSLPLVRKMVRRGANIDEASSHGSDMWYMYPIISAAEKGEEDIFKYLVVQGAKLHGFIRDNNENLLHLVAHLKSTYWVPYLVNQGVDINRLTTASIYHPDQVTPLYNAAVKQNRPVFIKMLRCGAQINLQNADGNTMAHVLARQNNINALQYFLEAGADLTIKNHFGFAVLDLVESETFELEKFPRFVDHTRKMKLHQAIQQALIQQGAVANHSKVQEINSVKEQLLQLVTTNTHNLNFDELFRFACTLIILYDDVESALKVLQRLFGKNVHYSMNIYDQYFKLPGDNNWTPSLWQQLFEWHKPSHPREILIYLLPVADGIEKVFREAGKRIGKNTKMDELVEAGALSYYSPNAKLNLPAAKLFLEEKVTPDYFNKYIKIKTNTDHSLVPPIKINGSTISEAHSHFNLIYIAKEDPLIPVIGFKTGCCERAGGPGEHYVDNCLINPECGLYVIEDTGKRASRRIVSYCIAWRIDAETMIYTSIETNINYRNSNSLQLIADMFMLLSKQLMDQHGIKRFLIWELISHTPPFLVTEAPVPLEIVSNLKYLVKRIGACIVDSNKPHMSFYGQIQGNPIMSELLDSGLSTLYCSPKDLDTMQLLYDRSPHAPHQKQLKTLVDAHRNKAQAQGLIKQRNRFFAPCSEGEIQVRSPLNCSPY